MSEHMRPLIDTTNQTVSRSSYPGYPGKRLIVTDPDTLPNMTLPDGEWSTGVTTFPTLEQQQQLRDKGCELDDYGRPLHPWLREMITETAVGVVTGLGEYWHWGPNKTGDPVIIGDGKVLLIKRSDTGNWALPGGYANDGETGHQAARRELFEEAGILVSSDGSEVYDGPVADSRTTAHAWPETTAVVWHVGSTPEPTPNDDAIAAHWFPIDELPDDLHGSHLSLIQTAIEKLDEVPIVSAFSLPEKTVSYRAASGGHMAYTRFLIETDEGEIFVKSHDKQVFTDVFREERSRKYLQKEKHIYDHVAQHHPDLLPKKVRMIADHSIVMESLSDEQGWQWRAPSDFIDTYINEVAAHLISLQDIPLPDEKFRTHMKPTYETHKNEGWDIVTNDVQTKIIARLREFQPRMKPGFQAIAENLIRDLSMLQDDFNKMDDPEEYYFCHHDLRPANLAWHEKLGTKIIDWSWAGAGRKNSDTTTLLVDLHKSGHDVQAHIDLFNPDHALTLVGFYLAHSLWSTRTDDNSVRFQQIVSAVSAYDLLMKYRER